MQVLGERLPPHGTSFSSPLPTSFLPRAHATPCLATNMHTCMPTDIFLLPGAGTAKPIYGSKWGNPALPFCMLPGTLRHPCQQKHGVSRLHRAGPPPPASVSTNTMRSLRACSPTRRCLCGFTLRIRRPLNPSLHNKRHHSPIVCILCFSPSYAGTFE